MMTNWTVEQHTIQRRPITAVYTVVCALGQSSSANNIDGKLRPKTSIDNRQLRH